MKRSRSEIGRFSIASIVRRSFSPAKASAAMTDDTMSGTIKNSGAIRKPSTRMRICSSGGLSAMGSSIRPEKLPNASAMSTSPADRANSPMIVGMMTSSSTGTRIMGSTIGLLRRTAVMSLAMTARTAYQSIRRRLVSRGVAGASGAVARSATR
jgi:hypothetical protein